MTAFVISDVKGLLECNTFFNFVTVNSLCVYYVTTFSLSVSIIY